MTNIEVIPPQDLPTTEALTDADSLVIQRNNALLRIRRPLATFPGDGDGTGVNTFNSRADAVAATINSDVHVIFVRSGAHMLAYRDYSGTSPALTDAGGRTFGPVDIVSPQHWAENTTPGTTDMRAAIQGALNYLCDRTITGPSSLFPNGFGDNLDFLGENLATSGPVVIGDVNGTGAGFTFGLEFSNGSMTALSTGTWTNLQPDVPGYMVIIADWKNVSQTDAITRLMNIRFAENFILNCNYQTGGRFWENTRGCYSDGDVLNVGPGSWGELTSAGAATDNSRGVLTRNTELRYSNKVSAGSGAFGANAPLSITGICTLQAPDGSNNLVINGGESSGGSWSSPTGNSHIIEIRSNSPYNDGGDNVQVTITGTSDGTTPLTEVVTLRRNSTQFQASYSTNRFRTVTAVSTNGNQNGQLAVAGSMQNGGFNIRTPDIFMENCVASQMAWALQVTGNGAVQGSNCHFWSREVIIGPVNFWTQFSNSFLGDFTDVRVHSSNGVPISLNGINMSAGGTRIVLVANVADDTGRGITIGPVLAESNRTRNAIDLEPGAGSWTDFISTEYSVIQSNMPNAGSSSAPIARGGSDAQFHVDYRGYHHIGNKQATGEASIATVQWDGNDFRIIPNNGAGAEDTVNEFRYRESDKVWTHGGIRITGFAPTRADLAALAPVDGTLMGWDGLLFRRLAASTIISDLNGWVPAGDVYPDHFTENVTPGTTDMLSAFNSALAFSDVVRMRATAYGISDTIVISNAATQIIGMGRGTGSASNSSLYKQTPSYLNWTGSGTKYMIEINPGAFADVPIRWGGRLEGFGVFGNGIAGVSGIRGGAKTAQWVYRDLEVHGVVNCYDLGRDAYACTFINCGAYEYSGYGWETAGDNHNCRWIACQMNHCLLTSPLGGVYVSGEDGGASTGLAFLGCDFEPNNAPNFLWLRRASGVTITGCYFEVRSNTTQQLIRLGESAVPADRVIGVSITGNTLQGKSLGREAVMIQNAASGVDIRGNHAFGFTGSFVNNASPGTRNQLGQNWLSSTPENFVGGDAGFVGRSRSRLSADTAAITTDTPVLDHTHPPRDTMRPRLVTARLPVTVEDAAATNVSSVFVLQKFNGSTWADLGAFARSQLFVNAGTRGISSQVVTIEEEDASGDVNTRYRVSVQPGTDDSAVVLAGASITVKELE